MLYKIGTLAELKAMKRNFPECVAMELTRDLAILDCEYGEDRDIREEGGYTVVIETAEDLTELERIIDFTRHPCEWATRLGKDTGWAAILFLLTDDYSIMVFMPVDVMPDVLLKDLED